MCVLVFFIYISFMCLLSPLQCASVPVSQAKCCKYVPLCFSLFCPPGIPAITADLSPLTSYPRHPTHIYTFTFISKHHALTDQKYIAMRVASQTVLQYIGTWHFGWTVAWETLRSKVLVIDTCTDARALKIALRSLGHCYLTPSHPPTHTHTAAGQPASWHRSI